MILHAIDPGKQGAICRLDTDAPHRSRITLYGMPLDGEGEWCPWLMAKEVWNWKLTGTQKVIIEQCHAFPGAQAFSSSGVMEAYGMWRGVLACQFAPSEIATPSAAKWKKDMGITLPVQKAGRLATKAEKDAAYKARKALAVAKAEQEFDRPFRTPKGRLMDGPAEAALLALWGSR